MNTEMAHRTKPTSPIQKALPSCTGKTSLAYLDLKKYKKEGSQAKRTGLEDEFVMCMKRKLESIENKFKVVQIKQKTSKSTKNPFKSQDLNVDSQGDFSGSSAITGEICVEKRKFQGFRSPRDAGQRSEHLAQYEKSDTLDLSLINEREKYINNPNDVLYQSYTENTGLTESNIDPYSPPPKPSENPDMSDFTITSTMLP